MRQQQLILKQLERRFKAWELVRQSPAPKIGWVRLIRKGLGITTQLAKRLKVHRSRVIKIEQAELGGAITLHTLKGIAEVLDCDLVYALVPREPLGVILQNQARKIALKKVQKVAHSMALEDQSVGQKYQEEQVKKLTEELLSGATRHLWNEE
jgi:predicted DNA-binding mobile mystery protein A